MSVINKMLKDLDERQIEDERDADEPLQRNFVPKNKTQPNYVLAILALIFVVLVVIAWKLISPQTQIQSSHKNTSQEITDTANVDSSSKIVHAGQTQSVESSKSNGTEGPNAKLIKTEQPSSQLNSIRVANVASENPNKDGALGKSEIAKINANNKTVTESQFKQNTQAENDTLTLTEADVKPKLNNENATVKSGGISQSQRASQTTVQAQKSPLASNQNQNQEPQDLSSSGKFKIERSVEAMTPEQLLKKRFDSAKKSFEKGYISEGIEQLEEVLAMSDDHIDARNILAGAWYGRGEVNRAVAILNNGLQRYPNIEPWRLTAAKIYFKENNLLGALSYLEPQDANSSKEYLTFKGTLGRQVGYFEQAELAYLQLAQNEPTSGSWWLGLAISQDSQGKIDQARESYQQLLKFGGVSVDSINFAKQRLIELKG